MNNEQEHPDVLELGAASALTEGAVFGIPEADGLRTSLGLSAE